jgi:hypothetical protein
MLVQRPAVQRPRSATASSSNHHGMGGHGGGHGAEVQFFTEVGAPMLVTPGMEALHERLTRERTEAFRRQRELAGS